MAIHSFHSEQEMEEKKQQKDRLHIRRTIHTVKLITRCHSQFKQQTRTTCLHRPRSVLTCSAIRLHAVSVRMVTLMTRADRAKCLIPLPASITLNSLEEEEEEEKEEEEELPEKVVLD